MAGERKVKKVLYNTLLIYHYFHVDSSYSSKLSKFGNSKTKLEESRQVFFGYNFAQYNFTPTENQRSLSSIFCSAFLQKEDERSTVQLNLSGSQLVGVCEAK